MIDDIERKVLIACKKLHTYKKKIFDEESVSSTLKQLFEDEEARTAEAIAGLLRQGRLCPAEGGSYSLSASGLELATKLDREHESTGFDRWLTLSAGSAAYAAFCRRVYGTDFIQFNMVDAEQFEALLSVLRPRPGERIADLGCGMGFQAERISDRTGARVSGLDFAPGAIAAAKARCASKAERLDFVLGDLNEIGLPRGSFEAALSFDTLYFVDDLEKTVADIAALLAPGGRMALFYSQTRKPDEAAARLEPSGTDLGRTLDKLNLGYSTTDFTANERRIWEEEGAAAAEFKSAFEAEGNLELWKSREEESREMLPSFIEDRAARYLYLARV